MNQNKKNHLLNQLRHLIKPKYQIKIRNSLDHRFYYNYTRNAYDLVVIHETFDKNIARDVLINAVQFTPCKRDPLTEIYLLDNNQVLGYIEIRASLAQRVSKWLLSSLNRLAKPR